MRIVTVYPQDISMKIMVVHIIHNFTNFSKVFQLLPSSLWALKTFNMGIGMAVICAEIFADDFMDALSGQGERVWRIGTVRKSEQGSKAAGQVIYE